MRGGVGVRLGLLSFDFARKMKRGWDEWRDKGKVLEPSISISYIEKISSECYFDVFQQNSIGCRF